MRARARCALLDAQRRSRGLLLGLAALSLAALSLAVLGCSAEPDKLALEEERAGFDPIRWDAGPEPPIEAPLPTTLRFAITPYYTPAHQRPLLERMRGYLAESLGVAVEADVSADYLGSVNDLASGAIDIAQLSPYACVEAKRRIPDVELIATAIAQGTTRYSSYLVVRRDSPIQKLEDVRGGVLGFTDRWSASGYLYPHALLVRRGFDPIRDFEARFFGQHDAALHALLAGDVDVAAVSSDTLVSQRVLGIRGPVRIIAKAGRIPYDCVAIRQTMAPALRHRVRRAFLTLSIHSERGRAVLADYNLINGFMPVPNGHYDEVAASAARAARGAP